MAHEIERYVDTLRATEELRRFRDELLIDVFRIWDCYAQDWIPNSPWLLRFESDDVRVELGDGGATRIVTGPVDTRRAPTGADGSADPDACRCWLRVDRAPDAW